MHTMIKIVLLLFRILCDDYQLRGRPAMDQALALESGRGERNTKRVERNLLQHQSTFEDKVDNVEEVLEQVQPPVRVSLPEDQQL